MTPPLAKQYALWGNSAIRPANNFGVDGTKGSLHMAVPVRWVGSDAGQGRRVPLQGNTIAQAGDTSHAQHALRLETGRRALSLIRKLLSRLRANIEDIMQRSLFRKPGCLLLLCMLLMMLCPAHGATVIDVTPDFESRQLIRELNYLQTAPHLLSVDQVRNLPPGRFTSLSGTSLNRRFSDDDHWLRATVRNPTDMPVTWVMQNKFPITDYVDYWVFKEGRMVQHAVGGDRVVMSERQVPFRMPSVRYTSQPHETVELYIRAHNKKPSPLQLLFTISSERAFNVYVAKDQFTIGLLYGIPLALALSTLTGWLVAGIRNSEAPLYVAYVLSVLLGWIILNGQLVEYVFVDMPDLSNDMQQVIYLLASLSTAVFARRFLRTAEIMPRFDRYFALIIFFAVCGIALRMAGVYTFVIRMAVVLSLLCLATPFAAWYAWKKGIVYARWYFLAQLLYSAAVAIGFGGSALGRLTPDYFLYCEMAFFGELLLLGVAQHDRMRILRNERVEVERKYKSALEQTNAELEREVEERTRRLEQAYKRSQFLTEVKIATRRIADGEFSVRLQAGDSTDMRDLANSVNSMAESLLRLEGARKRWIAEISHELRTPLFALMCETEALLDGVRTLNRNAVASLHEEIQHLSSLVADLHELALSYLRPLPCTFTAWRLDEVAHKLRTRYGEHALGKGLVFELDMPAGHRIVVWDKGRIEQLLGNLVLNSISYTDAPGKILMTIRIAEEQACIEIQDTPPGVSADEAQHLFEPLYRADAARNRRSGGSGLGLSICQAIVQAHNGRIVATQSPLGGLAIRIDLPLAIEEHGRQSTQNINRG